MSSRADHCAGTERAGLVVAHEREIQVEAAVAEVASRLGLVEARDRRARQGEPNSSIVDGRAEPRRPGPGGQRFLSLFSYQGPRPGDARLNAARSPRSPRPADRGGRRGDPRGLQGCARGGGEQHRDQRTHGVAHVLDAADETRHVDLLPNTRARPDPTWPAGGHVPPLVRSGRAAAQSVTTTLTVISGCIEQAK
jgi:hypothetical protein